jgi:hypothetical protein
VSYSTDKRLKIRFPERISVQEEVLMSNTPHPDVGKPGPEQPPRTPAEDKCEVELCEGIRAFSVPAFEFLYELLDTSKARKPEVDDEG